MLAAFGPNRETLRTAARVVQADLVAQRRWVRQREADLGFLRHALSENERMSGEFAEWRTYIHELEGRLGLPLSGVEQDEPKPE
jgi:hypothetical protein